MKVFSLGNTKLSRKFVIFNMSPGHNCISNALGFCSLGNNCYARRTERLTKHTLTARERQEKFWLSCTVDEFIDELEAFTNLGNVLFLRFNEAGDFNGVAGVSKAFHIARILWDKYGIITYTYTKRVDLSENVISRLLCSYFVINGSGHMLSNQFDLVYPDELKEYENVCSGKCDECLWCMIGTGRLIGAPIRFSHSQENHKTKMNGYVY